MVELRRIKDLVNRIAEEESINPREERILRLEFMQYIGNEKTLSQRVIREEVTEIPCYDQKDEEFFKSRLILYASSKRLGPNKAPEPQPQENVYLAKKDKFSRVQGSDPVKHEIITPEDAVKILKKRNKKMSAEDFDRVFDSERSAASVNEACDYKFFKLVTKESVAEKRKYDSLAPRYEVTINGRVGILLYHFDKPRYYAMLGKFKKKD